MSLFNLLIKFLIIKPNNEGTIFELLIPILPRPRKQQDLPHLHQRIIRSLCRGLQILCEGESFLHSRHHPWRLDQGSNGQRKKLDTQASKEDSEREQQAANRD